MNSSASRTGGCLCGRVRYTAPATPSGVVVCHCRDCQKQAGSAFSIIAVFPRDAVHVEGDLARYVGRGDSGNTVERCFCGACGSPIYSDGDAMRERGILAIKAGTLDEVADLKPALHYWVVSKQSWIELPEGVRCLAAG